MTDKRSSRKASVVQFLTRLDKDRLLNISAVIARAKLLELEGFDSTHWNDSSWEIGAGRLIRSSGNNVRKVTLNFYYAEALGGEPLETEWADIIKALMVLRFHRKQQNASNQKAFIFVASFVAFELKKRQQTLFQLTPESLNSACKKISENYAKATAYNMHKFVGEFAAHCDANGLCNVLLDFKYSGMRRPESVGGIGQRRLDDPETLNTEGEKLVDPKVFKIIGELYLNVPPKHKYRCLVLMLSLLAMLGRRFSEISLLPFQKLSWDEDGRAYLQYFPRKSSMGDVLTPLRRLYIPSDIATIIEPMIAELIQLCSAARNTAAEMELTNGPDLNILMGFSKGHRFYKEDLEKIGLPVGILAATNWLNKRGWVFADNERLSVKGIKPIRPIQYTTTEGLVAYCKRDFHPNLIEPIHIDQHGKKYYLKDLLFVRPLGLSSGYYAHWISTKITHSTLDKFLDQLPRLATEYASSSIEVDFASHHFRHTLNTLLDEGGLSDLLQTEWFGRTNPRDTKAYQHTSREKRALLLREDIKAGKVGGHLAEQVIALPIGIQDAVLAARINAVHDVGPGICVHNFIQTPCARHLQCAADCKDYVWVKEDAGRKNELKRLFAVTFVARNTAENNVGGKKPKKSADWLAHNDKKLKVLTKQMKDYGIEPFDPQQYLEQLTND